MASLVGLVRLPDALIKTSFTLPRKTPYCHAANYTISRFCRSIVNSKKRCNELFLWNRCSYMESSANPDNDTLLGCETAEGRGALGHYGLLVRVGDGAQAEAARARWRHSQATALPLRGYWSMPPRRCRHMNGTPGMQEPRRNTRRFRPDI